MNRILLIASLIAGSLSLGFAGESRVELVTIFSPALGISKSFNIYLPEDYDERSDRYPAVYLFRGHEKEWVDGRGGRRIKEVADQLFLAGKIGRMILVMPGLTSEDESIMSFAINFIDDSPARGMAGIGTGKFEDYMIQDLIPYVDSAYRTLPSGAQRGTDGFSNGGFPAIMLALRHPDLFCSVGAFDGVVGDFLDFDNPFTPGPLDGNSPTVQFLNPHFGPPPRDLEYMKQYTPTNLFRYAEGERLAEIHALQFLLHSLSRLPQFGFRERNEYFVGLMASQGLQNAFTNLSLSPTAKHDWPDAYRHMEVSLPLHWQKFQNPTHIMPVSLVHPVTGSEVMGQVEIKWSVGASTENLQTTIFYSSDAGDSWQELATLNVSDSTYLWNTTDVPDGARYRLRVRVSGDSSIGIAQTEGVFTVNNPGNASPEIELLSPIGNEEISGEWQVRWQARDADGDLLTFSLDYSVDQGVTWTPVIRDIQNTETYVWRSETAANSAKGIMRLRCWDGTVEIADTSWFFEIRNERIAVSADLVDHTAGSGSGTVKAQIVDPGRLTGDLYRITFDDSTSANKSYDVLNVDTDQLVVENATQLDGVTEGPLFDGVRLVVEDLLQAIVDEGKTGWETGTSGWIAQIHTPTVNTSGGVVKGIAYPADYRITIFDHVVDTSDALLGAPARPMQFTVRNLTDDRRADILFVDIDNDQTISPQDVLYLFEPDSTGMPHLAWSVRFRSDEGATPPVPGDIFIFRTLKPLSSQDVFEFRAVPTSVAANKNAPGPVKFALFPNYPNPFNPETTISFQLPEAKKVKLEIFNIVGQRIRTLIHGTKKAGYHQVVWNGRSEAGNRVGSGMYYYRIQAAEFVSVKKMVLLK